MPSSQQKELIRLAIIFLIIAALIVVRMSLVEKKIGELLACPGCFHIDIAKAELVTFWITALTLLVAGWIRPGWIGRFLHLLVGLGLLYFIADLLVYRVFSYRLFLGDFLLYVRDPGPVWTQFQSTLGGPWAAGAFVATLSGGSLSQVITNSSS